MRLAFRVDLHTQDDRALLRPLNRDPIDPGDTFVHHGKEWVCEAVIVKYTDGVPYPAEALRLIIAGDKENRRSLVVSDATCEKVTT